MMRQYKFEHHDGVWFDPLWFETGTGFLLIASAFEGFGVVDLWCA
jgi:hypothetical protein